MSEKQFSFNLGDSYKMCSIQLGGPTLTIAALPRIGDHEQSVSFVELSQKFYLKDLNKIFDCAQRGCEKIRTILDEAIRSNANETAISELTDN